MLCSVLIPSRNGTPEGLASAVDSALRLGERFEVLVRLDGDDPDLDERISRVRSKAKIVIGPRLQGYNSGHVFINDLARLANGKWIAICDDDCTYQVNGHNVSEQLRAIPTEGFYVQPQWYQLNSNRYGSDYGCPGSIVPRDCWKKAGYDHIGYPVDLFLYQLCQDQKWQVKPIFGLTLYHARKEKMLTDCKVKE